MTPEENREIAKCLTVVGGRKLVVESREEISEGGAVSSWSPGALGDPPMRLKDAPTERFLWRPITRVMRHDGTYGMGGPGFVSFGLDEDFLGDRVVVTIWGADAWLHLNGCSMESECFNEAAMSIEEMEGELVGAHIKGVLVEKKSFQVSFSNGSSVELKADPLSRQVFQGTGEPRVWPDDEDLWDTLVVTDKPLWV